MILRQDGEDLILIRNHSGNTEEEFLEMNPDFIQTDNLPFSISDYFIYDQDQNIIVNPVKELQCSKENMLNLILDQFDVLMQEGTFETSLGFPVDNRRGGGKDDKDNVGSLIDLGQEPVYFKDSNNGFHILTLADLATLKQEMIQDGLGKYQWKWTKESEIMSATSLEDLENIIL